MDEGREQGWEGGMEGARDGWMKRGREQGMDRWMDAGRSKRRGMVTAASELKRVNKKCRQAEMLSKAFAGIYTNPVSSSVTSTDTLAHSHHTSSN